MDKTSTSSPKKSASSANQELLFEVEIQTGNRAQSVQPQEGNLAKAPAAVGSPLARRRERAAERRSLIRICLLTLTLGLAVWSTAGWWQPMLVGDVVARVNGQPITYQQVEKEIRLSKALSIATTGKEQAPTPPAMLEQIILLELQVQAARQANFTVNSQDVDGEIAKVVQQAGVTPGKLDESLRTYGLTRDDLYASLSRTALANQFAERNIAGSATDPRARLARVNEWQANLVQKARIERVRDPNTGVGPRVGTEAPDFTLKQIGGKEVRLSSLRGTTVMIYVWAPWCPACRAEVPILERAYQAQATSKSSDGGFEILAVAAQSQLPNVTAFMQEFGITFPVFMDTQDEVTNLYQAWAIPTSIFVDKTGVIQAIQVGQMDAAALQRRLQVAK